MARKPISSCFLFLCAAVSLSGCTFAQLMESPSLSEDKCLAARNGIHPEMTVADAVSLLGKPYGVTYSHDEMKYFWMEGDFQRQVSITFETPVGTDRKAIQSAPIQSIYGHCVAGRSFKNP